MLIVAVYDFCSNGIIFTPHLTVVVSNERYAQRGVVCLPMSSYGRTWFTVTGP